MMRRLFPHPYLSVLLFITWFLLVNDIKLGSTAIAAILATAIPNLARAYWPDHARIAAPFGLVAYALLVLWDILVANVQVARIILFMPRDRITSAWIAIPIDLTAPEAITLLAGTITMTPGTLTADMSACGRVLLIHTLHTTNPDAVRDAIKARYETRLKRIFA